MMDMYVSVKCIFNKCPINIIVPYINCGWQRENNEIHFTNDILAHSWNKILKHFFPLIYIVMSQWGFHTCHDSYAVVTCAKLWLDWVIILSHKSTTYLQKIQIMNSKTLFEIGFWCTQAAVMDGDQVAWGRTTQHTYSGSKTVNSELISMG